MNDHPYRPIITSAFEQATARQRRVLRFLYRAFRKQHHSTPFSARAQIVNYVILSEQS